VYHLKTLGRVRNSLAGKCAYVAAVVAAGQVNVVIGELIDANSFDAELSTAY
jgi:hypothetical protein